MPAVSGFLQSLAVDIGTRVKRGQVVAELESRELNLELAKAESLVQQSRARVATSRARVQGAVSSVDEAKAKQESDDAALRLAQSSLAYRERQYKRIADLVKQGSVEHRLLDEEDDRRQTAKAALAAAQAAVAAARAGVDRAKAGLEEARAMAREVEADLAVVEADRDKPRLMVESLQLRSPIDGIVTRRNYHVGEFVRSGSLGGSMPIVTIVQTHIVRLATLVPDRDVPLVNVGDPATFRAQAYPAREYRGKVSRIADTEDTNNHTMRVEIDLDNADGRLRSGQFGMVRIELEDRPAAIAIPTDAIKRDRRGEPYCLVVEDGRAVPRPIKAGVWNDGTGHTEVLEGLKEGDCIVAYPGAIQDGHAVKPVTVSRGR